LHLSAEASVQPNYICEDWGVGNSAKGGLVMLLQFTSS
jgi:hypothetical protein